MNKTILLFWLIILTSCSSSKIITLVTQCQLSTEEFNTEIPFYYVGKYIFIDVEINRKTYTFLFDTGWDITHIDKSFYEEIEFSPLKKYKTSGSSFKTAKLQYGFIPSLKIGSLDFKNIGVGIQDLSFVKSTFPDKRKIYGIIGTNVLRKAFWQIDYKKQIIKFTNKIENIPIPSNTYQIPMIPKRSAGWGLNKINLSINGVTDDFVFDTGSYGSFTADYSFLERLEEQEAPLQEITIQNQIDKQVFKINKLKINTLELNNLELGIEKDIDLLIGNDFLEDYIVTIDWTNNKLFLQPISN